VCILFALTAWIGVEAIAVGWRVYLERGDCGLYVGYHQSELIQLIPHTGRARTCARAPGSPLVWSAVLM